MIGWWIQSEITGDKPYPNPDIFKIPFLICYILLCIYYVPAIWVSFYAYREFKAMMFEGGAPAAMQGQAPDAY